MKEDNVEEDIKAEKFEAEYRLPRTCPECNETYLWEDNGHDWDAIGEHGKCTDCLGKCPYCDEAP